MLDHGVLNVPIVKRGNIHAEIDRFKKTQAQNAKSASRQHHLDRQAARTALRDAPDAHLRSLAGKLNLTMTQTRQRLRSECVSSPRLVLGFLAI
jgi:phage gp36-like protein